MEDDNDKKEIEIKKLDQPNVSKEEFQKVKSDLETLRNKKEKLFEIRSVVSQEIKDLFGELKKLKDERDALTSGVQAMKDERDNINTEIKELIEEVKKLRDVKGGSDEHVNLGAIKKNIEKMQYYLETNPLSPDEEKKVMKTIKENQKILDKAEGSSNSKSKLKTLSKRIDELKEKSNEIHSKVRDAAKSSQDKHESLIINSKDIKFLKAREKEVHSDFTNIKSDYKDIRTKFLENKPFFEVKRVRREDKEAAIKKKIEASVAEKMKTGQKITTEDLLAMQK